MIACVSCAPIGFHCTPMPLAWVHRTIAARLIARGWPGSVTFTITSAPNGAGLEVSMYMPPSETSRDVASIGATLTFHLLEGPLTPFATASLGWTWIDTNIATGPPELGCWWDPWWGQICTPIVDTASDDSASYGIGLGVRWDFGPGAFARVAYEQRYLDIQNANGTPDFGSVRFDIGAKF